MNKSKIASTVLLLAGALSAQQSNMPGMQMPEKKPAAQSPAQQKPGMQTQQRAKPNIESQEQASPQPQEGMQHMQMRSPEKTPSHVEGLQEPENPDQKTGQNLPVPDLLANAKAAPARSLNDFEQLALQNNPTIKQAQALVRGSAGLARQAGLWPNPSVGYQGEQIRGGSYNGGEQGAFVQQTIVLGGKLRLRRNVFEQEQKVNEAGLQEQKLNVVGGVRAQFYTALAQLRTVEIRQELLRTAIDAAATAHQLANVGQADAPDILQSEVEAEQEKLGLAEAQRGYIQAFQQLATIVGQPDMPLSLLDGKLDAPPEIDTAQAMQNIIQNSPSIKRAEEEANRAQAALKRDKREAIPDLTLRAGFQQNREQDPNSLRPVGGQGFASASIQIPIFNRNQGNIEAAKAEFERNHQEVARIKLVLAQQAQPLIQRYETSRLQAERYRTQMIPRAQRAYQLYLQKYQSMAAAYPEVIISQRTLFQLQESYTRSLAELWSSAIELQNFLLVDGLTTPRMGQNVSTEINLPTSGSGANQ